MKTLRLLLILLLVVAPVAFWALIWRPASVRMEATRSRIDEAQRRIQELPHYAPLTPSETALLEDPAAPWRQRIPTLAGDRERLAHYHRVVTAVDRGFRQGGLKIQGMRSSWDPIHASFTLDRELAPDTLAPATQPAVTGSTLKAWVLEVQLEGASTSLFTGLERVHALPPLLEPVGLRWESTPDQHRQSLWLRNLVLAPDAGGR